MDTARTGMNSGVVGSGFRPTPRLETAELGAQAGMIGVADLARNMV